MSQSKIKKAFKPLKKKYTNRQIAALADAFDRDIRTVLRWIKEDDYHLTCNLAKETLLSLSEK